MEHTTDGRPSITNTDELFTLIQEIADIGGWEYDRETNTVLWSDHLYDIHGVERGAVETVEDAIRHYHPSDQGTVRATLDELVAEEEDQEIEARIVRPDDEVRWVRVRAAPWYDDGDLRGAHGTIQDITDEKQREIELELFREAVEQAGHGVVITNREGKIEYANPAYEQDTGYELGDILGKNPRFAKSGKHDAAFYEEMWGTILDGEIWETEELINRRNSGELYHVDQTIAPITTDGEITHFIGIESEITDLRLREQRLDVLNRLLRHNLRNSITVIQGHLSAVESVTDDTELASHVETITDRIDQLTSISDKVSTLQSLFDEGFDTDVTYDMTDEVDSLTREFAAEYPDAVITTTTPADSVTARCDDRITVALTEAIENAIVHNDRASPEVTVSVFYPDDPTSWVTVRVADNGPGIPDQDRKAIEIGEETAITHGSSIGLWIIYWIVTAFGGDVTISSNTPYGSILDMTIPSGEPHTAE